MLYETIQQMAQNLMSYCIIWISILQGTSKLSLQDQIIIGLKDSEHLGMWVISTQVEVNGLRLKSEVCLHTASADITNTQMLAAL